MSGQIISAAAGAVATTTGSLIEKAAEALIKVVIENPKASLVVVGAVALTAVVMNSKGTIDIKIKGGA